jgi:hypothetical protein
MFFRLALFRAQRLSCFFTTFFVGHGLSTPLLELLLGFFPCLP